MTIRSCPPPDRLSLAAGTAAHPGSEPLVRDRRGRTGSANAAAADPFARDVRASRQAGRAGPGRRRAGFALVGMGVAMLPWLVFLAVTLPRSAHAAHWSLAWVGLDAAEALGLTVTGSLLRRAHPTAALTGTATATLLLVDAWFDITTAASSADRLLAMVMAVGAEIPLAVLCAVLAVGATGTGRVAGFERGRDEAAVAVRPDRHRPAQRNGCPASGGSTTTASHTRSSKERAGDNA
ncbi:hypothetical protein ACFZDK_51855 [Streptomyces sp. NPDC007901]|uniref:hypothetical protein n=1 Tax=Streptomyces sp. NPDC007901 TaxID=3364785 RepID=UPI0036EC5C7B